MASGRFITGIALGAAVGAALALVYTPRAGEENRARVAEATKKWREWFAKRKREAELRAKGAALQQMGELMKEAGQSEQELADQQAAEAG